MLLFDDGETQLLIDGFSSRPSMQQVATSMIQTDAAAVDAVLSRAQVNGPKALLVAHSHFDHALDVAYIVQRTGAKLYGSASTLNIGRGGGLTDDHMRLYEPGKALKFGQFTVTIMRSKHSPHIPGVNGGLGMVIDQPLRQPARFSALRGALLSTPPRLGTPALSPGFKNEAERRGCRAGRQCLKPASRNTFRSESLPRLGRPTRGRLGTIEYGPEICRIRTLAE